MVITNYIYSNTLVSKNSRHKLQDNGHMAHKDSCQKHVQTQLNFVKIVYEIL